MGKAGILGLSAVSTALLVWACTNCPPPRAQAVAPKPPKAPAQTHQEGEPRTPLVATGHPDWERVEATSAPNSCSADDQCYVGGCDAEMCSARPGLSSTCVGKDWPSKGGLCGCVAGKCSWYRAKAKPAKPAAPAEPSESETPPNVGADRPESEDPQPEPPAPEPSPEPEPPAPDSAP